MITFVTTKEEQGCLLPEKKFRTIQSTLGSNNVNRIIVESLEQLHSIDASEDIVIIETKDSSIISAITRLGIKHTGEKQIAIEYDKDKVHLKSILHEIGVPTPALMTQSTQIIEGQKYFVKPYLLEDSIGITSTSLCTTKEQILGKTMEIATAYKHSSIIEEYIEGSDCTVAVIRNGEDYIVEGIYINGNSGDQFLTYEAKTQDNETYSPIHSQLVKDMALKTFKAIGAKNYARIDFRIDNNLTPYLIEVNLYAGLGSSGYMYKCLEYNTLLTYPDMLDLIINTANNTLYEKQVNN